MNPGIGALLAQIIPIVALADILTNVLHRFIEPAAKILDRLESLKEEESVSRLRLRLIDSASNYIYREARARTWTFAVVLTALAHSEAAALMAATKVPTSHAELIIAQVAIVVGVIIAVVIPVFEVLGGLILAKAQTLKSFRRRQSFVLSIALVAMCWIIFPLTYYLPSFKR